MEQSKAFSQKIWQGLLAVKWIRQFTEDLFGNCVVPSEVLLLFHWNVMECKEIDSISGLYLSTFASHIFNVTRHTRVTLAVET